MIRTVKTVTSDYYINSCFSTIKVSQYILPRLKRFTPNLLKNGVVYGFECDCSEKYIGETKKRFIERIKEHNQKSHDTAIYKHITKCPTFQYNFNTALIEKHGQIPTADTLYKSERREKLTSQFSLEATNLTNMYKRKNYEAMLITVTKPKLNAQVKHWNVEVI